MYKSQYSGVPDEWTRLLISYIEKRENYLAIVQKDKKYDEQLRQDLNDMLHSLYTWKEK